MGEARGGATTARAPGYRGLLLAVGLLVLCYLYWHLMLRWYILQRDDFWLVTITERPYGRFDLGDFLSRWWHDWSVRNGRSADALVRAMLRQGAAAMGWIAPAVITLCTAAGWRWLPPGRSPVERGVAMVAVLASVPVMVWVVPSISGNTVFWAAGIANYVIATALAVLACSWLVHPPRSRGVLWAVAVPSVLAAHLVQEQASLTVFFVAAVWWVLHRRRVGRRQAVLLLTSCVGFAVTLLTPGLWRRFGEVSDGEGGPGVRLTAVARFGSELVLQTTPLLVVVLLALGVAVVATWRTATTGGRRLMAVGSVVGWVAGLGGWAQSRAWRSGLTEDRCGQIDPVAGPDLLGALLLILLALVAVAGVGAAVVGLRTSLGDAPVLLAAGAVGTAPLSAAVGVCASRVWYPPLVWLLVLVVVLIHLLVARGLLPRAVLMVLALAAVAAAARWLVVAEPALRANHESYEGVLAQLEPVRQAGRGTVVFPADVPHPDFAKAPVYRLPSIACSFRVYYDLPDPVVLDDGSGPDAGLPEYCPRPGALPRGR